MFLLRECMSGEAERVLFLLAVDVGTTQLVVVISNWLVVGGLVFRILLCGGVIGGVSILGGV